jgi:hypothetical protein
MGFGSRSKNEAAVKIEAEKQAKLDKAAADKAAADKAAADKAEEERIAAIVRKVGGK